MLRNVAKEICESLRDPIFKYIPKKLGKSIDKKMTEIESWIDSMKFPYESGWMGYYGGNLGQLEFNVKQSLNFDYDEALELVGDQEVLNFRIEDYYSMGREDLEETLKSEFGIDDFSYDGRQGGYLLVGDYENAIYGGTGIERVSIWYDDNYGDEIEDVIEIIEGFERLIMNLTEEGPLGDMFDDYLKDIEELLAESENFDTSIKNGATKIIQKNYTKLDKRISQITNGFGDGFMDYLTDMAEAN